MGCNVFFVHAQNVLRVFTYALPQPAPAGVPAQTISCQSPAAYRKDGKLEGDTKGC